jgi:hypothetical protein
MVVTTSDNKISRVRGCVTNNNGFWIGWLALLTPPLKSLSINDCLKLAPFCWTVTDLVLIYESLTSGLRMNYECQWRLTYEWITNHSSCTTELLTSLRMNAHQLSPFYNFGEDRIQVTTPNSSSIILCLSVVAETCVNFVAAVWFSRVYNFPFSYPWKTCFVTSWFPRINLSATTYLSIRFLETPVCHSILNF